MRHFISERVATFGLLIILSSTIVFHLLVIVGIIPFEIVWGGRLKDSSQMISFETVSIIINLIMLATVCFHAGFLKIPLNRTLVKIALWSMAGLFMINTIGNLFSNNEFEKIVFTPLTLLLAAFSLRLAISKEVRN